MPIPGDRDIEDPRLYSREIVAQGKLYRNVDCDIVWNIKGMKTAQIFMNR